MKKVFLCICLLLPFSSCEEEDQAVSLARKVRELQLKGLVSGFECATVNIACPEEHRHHLETLGMIESRKKNFTFIVNIPQSYLKQFFLDTLRIKAKMFNDNKLAVEPIEILITDEEGEEKTIFLNGNFIDKFGHASSFYEGGMHKGEWYCKSCIDHFKAK